MALAEEKARGLVGRTVLGRYRLGEPFAVGPGGATFHAEHVQTGRPAAVEVLFPEAVTAEAVARLERAALVGGRIEHPGVASGRELGALEDGSRVLVTDATAGVTLRELLARGPLPPARALALGAQLAEALAALHARGIAHLGVSPDVARVAPHEGPGSLKLVDLGGALLPPDLVAAGPQSAGSFGAGSLRPPSPYDAPELGGAGRSSVSPSGGAAAHVFSLGLVLVELLTGAPPHAARAALALPSARPPELDALIARMLSERPDVRPGAAQAAQVLGALGGPALLAASPSPPLVSTPGADVTFLARAPGAPSQAVIPAPGPFASGAMSLAASSLGPGPGGPAPSGLSASGGAPVAASSSPALTPATRPSGKGFLATLPPSLRAGVFGSGAVVLVVLSAIGLRPPLDALESGATAAPRAAPTGSSSTGATPSAAPSAAPAPAIACDARPSPSEARQKLVRAADGKRYRDFRGAVEGLVCSGPIAAGDEKDVQRALFDILQDVMIARTSNVVSEEDVDRIFSLVGRNTGTLGPDVFLQLVTTRSSMGATRAKHELKDPAVREHGTPAMRVAYDAHVAGTTCEALEPLFARIKKDGDRRSVRPILRAHDRCGGRRSGCCGELRSLVDHLKDRGLL